MGLYEVLLFTSVASSFFLFSLAANIAIFDVTQFGAKGNGKTDDSQAFLKAWNATCGATGRNPTLKIPRGKMFFINPLSISGPCKSSSVRIQIDGYLTAPSSKGAWKNCVDNTWIVISDVNGLNIQGTGTLDAKGSIWWDTSSGSDDVGDRFLSGVDACQKPATLSLQNCNTTRMTGLHFLNSGGNHISIGSCTNLEIFKINIKAPENSPNTDGIDIIRSSQVIIRDSIIGTEYDKTMHILTGDDCIALNTDNSNINISGITCGPGHGISIGSLGRDGGQGAVDGVYVQRCNFYKTLTSCRVKTWPGGSGYAKNIFYDHITVKDVKTVIEINQHYSNSAEQAKAVQVSNIHFTNVKGTSSVQTPIYIDCSEHVPCQEIYLQQVNITSSIHGGQVNAICNHANVGAEGVTPALKCSA